MGKMKTVLLFFGIMTRLGKLKHLIQFGKSLLMMQVYMAQVY